MDIEKAFSLIPGKKRLNLHAIYVSSPLEGRDIDQLEVKDFQGWIDWAKHRIRFQPDLLLSPDVQR